MATRFPGSCAFHIYKNNGRGLFVVVRGPGGLIDGAYHIPEKIARNPAALKAQLELLKRVELEEQKKLIGKYNALHEVITEADLCKDFEIIFKGEHQRASKNVVIRMLMPGMTAAVYKGATQLPVGMRKRMPAYLRGKEKEEVEEVPAVATVR